MTPLKLMKLFYFILANGSSISEQIDQLIAFVQDIKDRFVDQSTAMSEGVFDELADKHPEIANCCDRLAEELAEGQDAVDASVMARPRGVFKDLFKDVIDNPQKYIDLFMLFKGLFGLEAQAATTEAGSGE